MKHPVLTVQRNTTGFIYRFFCLQHLRFPLLQNVRCWQPVWFVIKVIVLLHIIMRLLQHDYYVIPLPSLSSDPTLCNRVTYFKDQHKAVSYALKEQIDIQTRLLDSGLDATADVDKLVPIVQEMYKRKKRVCAYDRSSQLGPVQVNLKTSTLNKDLKILQQEIKDLSGAYKTRNVKSVNDGDESDNFVQPNSPFNSEKEVTKVGHSPSIKFNKSLLALPLSLDETPHGVHSPANCFPHRRTAIIIPYRNRSKHLKLFLRHMHPFLSQQEIEYGIYIINLAGSVTFNRAKLLNIGFQEALLHYEKYDCVIFHDVDLLPEDSRNLYTCDTQPKHMSVAIDIFDYKIPYQQIFGGVTGMTPAQFYTVNGYSNEFWGWGGEDDDMSYRIRLKCMEVFRISKDIARYHMAIHNHDKGNEVMSERFNLLKGSLNRQAIDGLSSLKYRVLSREYDVLYNNITVEIGYPHMENGTTLEIYFHLAIAAICIAIIYIAFIRSTNRDDRT